MRKVKALIIIIIAGLVLIPSPASSQKGRVSKQFPVYDNGGKPDLVVDPHRFVSSMQIIDRLFSEGNCAIEAGLVGGAGTRRLIRFDTILMNSGNGDLVAGDRSDPSNAYAEKFEIAACSNHYQIGGFSNYELLNTERTVVVTGHKQGASFGDSFKFGGGDSNNYNLGFQGITSGWAAWYYRKQAGQWIDITGLPEGDYIVRVTVNAAGTFDEGQNRYTNSVETSIHVPDPRKKVTIDNSPEVLEK